MPFKSKNKILICFGTRPEYLKIKPILDILNDSQYDVAFLNQHKDIKEKFKYKFLVNIPKQSNKNRLNSIMTYSLKNFPDIKNYKYILVQGDTTAALSAAVNAFHNNVDIIHLEAGLRSFNLKSPYPEEANRKIISTLASIHLAPTNLSKINLNNENIKKNIFVTGNTALDNLKNYKNKSKYDNKILITLHRREKLLELKQWVSEIDNIAKKNLNYEFIFAIHPNPLIKKISSKFKYIKKIAHLEHKNLLKIMSKCRLIISDSGGIQEEASFLNKKVIVCRDTTERPEGIYSGHLYLCKKPENLEKIFNKLINKYRINKKCPYGDGNSAKKILKILNNFL